MKMHGETRPVFCGSLESRYVTPGLDENLSMTRGQDTYYYMRDGLGSVRNVVGASETVENIYDYRAFGLVITEIEGVECPYRFTAREYEPGGLSHAHFYRNRYYMPGVGLFMSRDAMWADVHRGWGYVGNRPTTLVDPFGQIAYPYVVCGGTPLGLWVMCWKITLREGRVYRELLGLFILENRTWGFVGVYTWAEWKVIMLGIDPRSIDHPVPCA